MSSGVADQDAHAESAAADSAHGRRHDADGAVRVTSQDEHAAQVVTPHGSSQAAGVTALQHKERAQQQQQHDGQQLRAGSGAPPSQQDYMAEYQQRYPASYHEAGFGGDGDCTADR